VVKRVRRRTVRRPRVYTIRFLLLMALACCVSVAGAQAPIDLTVEPSMVKGASTARVTIVEFSDYQ
jgi:hypothetical protein